MRVLVVDDNRDAILILDRFLSLKGHQTRSASSGIEALRMAAGFQPEVVILDLRMPHMDGFELAKHLRQTEGLAGIRIIAHTCEPPRPECERSAGIDGRLAKPASLQQLLDALGTRETN